MRFASMAIAAAMCAASSGCVSAGFFHEAVPLAEQADQFNRAAADSDRMMIVRNVMRGRDRTSMVFTRISSMRGSMTRTANGSIGVNLGEGSGNDTSGLNYSMGGTSNPSFDFAVLSDEKFHRAMHSSIDMGIYQLLQDSGWPRDLLNMLFIERVQDGSQVFENDPQNWETYERFRNYLTAEDLRVCSRASPTNFGPVLALNGATDAEDIVAVAGARLRLNSASGGWQIARPGNEYFLATNCSDADGLTPETSQVDQTGSNVVAQTSAGEVRIRSIQGVLYYLGEVLREEARDSRHQVRTGNDPLFVILEGACRPGLTFVHDDGETYSISYGATCEPLRRRDREDEARRIASPSADLGRTHQVVTLMIQLIGMLQVREELPSTPAVQIVN